MILGALALVTVAGVAPHVATPIAVCGAADDATPRPSPARRQGTVEANGHPKKAPPQAADTDRGASTGRRSDDPTKGRSTGDAKQSGPGSGEGL
jgi:hypothetical protein